MKKIILCLISCIVLQAVAQTPLTVKEWQEDLKSLQNTVHTDYSFLFKKTTAKDFDAAVAKLHNEIPSLEAHEIVVGMSRIVSSFKYGHTALSLRSGAVQFHQMPFHLHSFNNGIYIQGVHKDYAKALGAKVIAIEGMPISEALKAVYPVVPVENEQFFNAYGINYLGRPEVLHAQGITKVLQQTISLTLEKEGKKFEEQFTSLPPGVHLPTQYGYAVQKEDWLDARDHTTTPFYLKHLDKIYYYQYIPEYKAVYVRHSQIQDDPKENIPTFYERVFDFIAHNDVERLILDVRLNGGGNNYKNKPIITGIISSDKINVQGKLFVIIGKRTFSACQNLVNELDTYTNAIFIGEPTAENINFYGDTRKFILPNSKIPVFLSFAWWQDKPQWENASWTAPHVAVAMSFEEYKTNKDPVLEVALQMEGTDFIIDPMGHFTDLFTAGKMEQIKIDAKKMVADPKYQFFDFEGQLNRAGYNVMGSGQINAALFIFQLNTELFPNSANAWDSLGEAYLKSKNFEKAKIYYNKAIQLDPDGVTGENARAMLRAIDKDK